MEMFALCTQNGRRPPKSEMSHSYRPAVRQSLVFRAAKSVLSVLQFCVQKNEPTSSLEGPPPYAGIVVLCYLLHELYSRYQAQSLPMMSTGYWSHRALEQGPFLNTWRPLRWLASITEWLTILAMAHAPTGTTAPFLTIPCQ